MKASTCPGCVETARRQQRGVVRCAECSAWWHAVGPSKCDHCGNLRPRFEAVRMSDGTDRAECKRCGGQSEMSMQKGEPALTRETPVRNTLRSALLKGVEVLEKT